MPTVRAEVLDRYRALSLYNSPYRAHDDGRAIDLYPASAFGRCSGPSSGLTPAPADAAGRATTDRAPTAPSPVAGEVVAIERLGAPSKPYAPEHDVLLAIDTGATRQGTVYRTSDGEPAIARVLHVDPSVAVGDVVTEGESLGELLRSGFFAPWVDPHVHLEFRAPDANLLRAGGGSLPIDLGVDVRPVAWDGLGTVLDVADSYAVLDAPEHPAPGESFAAIAGARSETAVSELVPLDGGLPHYEFGGTLAEGDGDVALLGTRVGSPGEKSAGDSPSCRTHRAIAWDGPTVTVDGEPIHGLSLAATRDALGVKLVCPELDLTVGETVHVGVEA